MGEASYQAQIRGVVADSTGVVLPNATVTITDVGTNVTQTATTGRSGEYILRALRPSTYVVKVGANGFQTVERKGVVLAVDQEASLNFTLRPAGTSTEVQVTEAAPLLDTGSSSLGTDITSEYVKEIPLLNRNFFGLVFLTAGVSETAGAGTADNYPSGTNFVSNGHRNATAEVRVDGALITAPEEGEGGNSNIFYEPSVEAVQEFKVQNNAFSAEFGSNGGTVVNMASLTTLARVKLFLPTLFRRRENKRHFALVEKLLTHRPRLVFFNLSGDAGSHHPSLRYVLP